MARWIIPDEFLATLDLVLASLHTSLRQPREKVTERLLNAIRNPHVDIIGHPTGRLIPDREGADLDMEAVLQGRRRKRRGAGDQRPPVPARPGRHLRPPREGNGHPDQHQHRRPFRSRYGHAASTAWRLPAAPG